MLKLRPPVTLLLSVRTAVQVWTVQIVKPACKSIGLALDQREREGTACKVRAGPDGEWRCPHVIGFHRKLMKKVSARGCALH